MIYQLQAKQFDEWRAQAKQLLSHDVPASEATWANDNQVLLFNQLPPQAAGAYPITVPSAFLSFAQTIACYRSEERWNLLYQLLFRLTHGEKHLLAISTDPLIHKLHLMEKAVRRDAHKMKAFVRFRKVDEEGGEHYIAWHEPDHYIVRRTAPFFARRFAVMHWSIHTPDDSAHWDGEQLHFAEGATKAQAPGEDHLEDLWRNYYRATFNPSRIKIKMMKQEMPVRYWKNLPETAIIQDMLAEAPGRVEMMLKHSEGSTLSAADFLPDKEDLPHLRKAAMGCEGCELYKPATQTVFGEGQPGARIMFVGEQPGDQEDKEGRPFIGPAGTLLAEALEHAGLKREDAYITNAVKHFRFAMQGKFRLHKAPLRQHVHACKPWLNAEVAVVKPEVIICLGNTAARALLGPGFTMKMGRGILHKDETPVLATYHPAAILRAQGDDRQAIKEEMFEDIRKAALFISK